MNAKSFLRILITILFLGFIFSWACKKNTASTQGPANAGGPNQSPPVVLVTATVTGRVTNANNEPLSGAAITTAFASTTTDVNGQFRLTNTQLDKNAAYIVVSKQGYFNGSKTFELTAGSSNYVEIELITKNQSGQFNTVAGGIVTLSNGGSINFSANSIVDSATGAAYSGTVTVSAYYLSASAQNFGDIMPGELIGIANDSSEKSLQSYGMMVAELAGSSGQKLQIASGKTATVSFPIPTSLISTAPSEIPLWYFDEIKGLWREKDSATLQGSNYVANVSHFSFWSCESSFPSIVFQVLVENKANTPISAARVLVKSADNDEILFGDGNTDVTGLIVGRIPSNSNLLLGVYDRCGNLVYTQTFSTTSSDINLGTINATVVTNPITFAGTLADCSGTGIANGILDIYMDGIYTSSNVKNGTFSVTINRCISTAATAQITAIDLTTNLQDTVLLQNVTTASFDSLKLSTCLPIDQYIYYSFSGVNDTITLANYSFSIFPSTETFGSGLTQFSEAIIASNVNNIFYIIFRDTLTIGSPQSNVTIYISGYDTTSDKLNTLTLTEFGNIGSGYLVGDFSGFVTDHVSLFPIQGRFRVRRTN
jgi:hypothetical protein